jgi:hypothetical protein
VRIAFEPIDRVTTAHQAVILPLDIGASPANHGDVEPIYSAGREADPFAIPGLHPRPQGEQGGASNTLEVEGELFALCSDEQGETAYLWLTGPNDGYGFGSSPTTNWSTRTHEENIRSFLAQIDPTTGYIEDD